MIPNITYNEMFWEGFVCLEQWNDFFEKELMLELNIGGDSIISNISEVHENGYNYLISNQASILENILNAVFENYSTWQDEYGFDDEDKMVFMPNITNSSELKRLILPHKLFIMDIDIEGIPYIGAWFNCKWDEEHGVGAMLFKDRVIKIGGADTAFMTWIAEEDKENIRL